jgi:hypothetical protein
MNLRTICIGLDYDKYISRENELRYAFQQRTGFISNYFSRAIRRFRFKTDGSFDMIFIAAHEDRLSQCSIVPINVLKVELPFERSRYERIKDSEDYSYYMELLENGIIKASQFKKIPLEILQKEIAEFKIHGCRNEWRHKQKRFKDDDLEIILSCEFTPRYFQLVATFNQISKRDELTKGVILRTEPDEVVFEGMFKDILIDKDIIITDKAGYPRIQIKKADLFKKKLTFAIKGDPKL